MQKGFLGQPNQTKPLDSRMNRSERKGLGFQRMYYFEYVLCFDNNRNLLLVYGQELPIIIKFVIHNNCRRCKRCIQDREV